MLKKIGSYIRKGMTLEEETDFVCACFSTYEKVGFTEVYNSPECQWENGMKYTVIRRASIADQIPLPYLPAWFICLENGNEVLAYPENICKAAKNGTDFFRIAIHGTIDVRKEHAGTDFIKAVLSLFPGASIQTYSMSGINRYRIEGSATKYDEYTNDALAELAACSEIAEGCIYFICFGFFEIEEWRYRFTDNHWVREIQKEPGWEKEEN